VYNNPLSNVIADLTYLDKVSVNGTVYANIVSSSFDHWTYSVDIQNESMSDKKENISQSNK